MWVMLKLVLDQFLFLILVVGGMLLLFTNMRFDYAAYISLAAVVVFATFVYWPRRR